MAFNIESSCRIKVLREDVARKIAAGEVIDRPFSVVRELLDNSIDAESSEITLTIENGGLARIRVTDNGIGMSASDLKLCYLPHSTSKISTSEDIYKIKTLGFRGEALSSIATCAKMEIISAQNNDSSGNKIVVHGGKLITLEAYKSKPGTFIDVSSLFYNMPGRKNFLKSPSGESYMCRFVFLEKAIPFPDITFRYFAGNTLKLFLPESSLCDRITSAYSEIIPPGSLDSIESKGDGFLLKVAAARPELTRKDRKHIQIFVNKRRVSEYSLIQAVEYGYSGSMPGKEYPLAYIFIEIDPQLVDFNIHPAKKECRIRILPQIHQRLVELLKSFTSKYYINIKEPADYKTVENKDMKAEQIFERSLYIKESNTSYTKDSDIQIPLTPFIKSDIQLEGSKQAEGLLPRYLGQAFSLFLLAEFGEHIYIIDQHAAHERILYNELQEKEIESEQLLFPFSFDVTEEEENILEENRAILSKMGIIIEKAGRGCFEITALPSHFISIDSKELMNIIKTQTFRIEDFESKLLSMVACRNAIKDGYEIDQLTAQKLVEMVFLLDNARCPHGRPIWYKISKEDLFSFLKRK